ncbi:DUF2079 domain-containing protein, partial [Myxococcota bacterium]
NPWGVVARCLTLCGGLGAALMLTIRYSIWGSWLELLLVENDLEMELRMRAFSEMSFGGAVGAILAGVALWHVRRRGRPMVEVERVLWVLSPLLLLPCLPLFMTHEAWKDRHEALLPCVLLVALALEVLATRSLTSLPRHWGALLDGLRARLPTHVSRYGPWTTVAAATFFYWAFISFYALRWHYKLKTANFDLSINNNLLYGALHGAFMDSPVVFPDNPSGYIATHMKLGQYVLLPLYAVYPGPETLLVLQSALLGLGAIPLFAFAKRHVSSWQAAAIAVAYLCYHPMHSASFFEFQYVCIAAVFVIATIWAADAKRWLWLAAFYIAAGLMREDLPVGLSVIGVFLLLTGHRPRAGLAMAVVGMIWFVTIKFFVMDKAGEWWFPKMYKSLWAPGEEGHISLLKTVFTNPPFVLDKIIESSKVYYLLHLLVPLAFLPARRWYLWAAFIPGGAWTLLATDYKPPTMFSFQYVMFWAPYIFVAAPLALESINRWPGSGPARVRAALLAMLFSTAILSYNYGAFAARNGSLKSGYRKVEFSFSDAERRRYQDLKEIVSVIPDDATVAATENVGPHVSTRKTLFTMRHGPHGAEYILASKNELGLHSTRPTLTEALESQKYGVVKRVGDFAVMRRGHDPSLNRALIRDWGLH